MESFQARMLDLQALRSRLEEAETVLEAIHTGSADALVVSGAQGLHVFTRQGADDPYRALVEVMSEGAALIGLSGAILHCNQRFSELLGLSVEQALGASVRTFIRPADLHRFEAAVSQIDRRRTVELILQSADGRPIPLFLSLSRLALGETHVICLVATDLTEQKRQEGIIAAQQLSRSILDQSAEAIFVCDHQGLVSRCSQQAVVLCGQNPVGRSFDEAVPLRLNLARDFASYGSRDTRFSIAGPLRGERFQGLVGSLERADGSRVDLLLNASPLTQTKGRIHGCVVTLTDITERKRATEALEELRRRDELILEALGEGVCMLDGSGRITFVNPAACKLLGRGAGELQGQSLHRLVHGTGGAVHGEQECPFLQARKDGRPSQGTEETFFRRDGSAFPVNVVSTPLREGQEVVGAVVVFTDVSERVNAERELRAAIERLNSTLTSITDCSIVLDADWRIVQINPAAARALGRAPEQLVGRSVWDEFPAARDGEFAQQCRRAMDERRPAHFESQLVLTDAWFETHVYPWGGRLEVFFKDITGRKRHEAELAALRDELAAQVRDLTRLQSLGSRLLSGTDTRTLLLEVLGEAMALQGADMGELRLYDPALRRLQVVAQVGLPHEFLAWLNESQPAATAYRAPERGGRVLVEDVETSEVFQSPGEGEARRAMAGAAGFRAMQSTPLFGLSGELLGLLSTYFRSPRRFSDWQLGLLDLYADQAAKLIERVRAEEALRQSEQEFRAMFDLAGVGKVQAEVETGRFLRVNRKFCEITGYTPEELLRLTMMDITHPDHQAETAEGVMRMGMGEPAEYTTETRYIRKDGRAVWVHVTGTVIRGTDGRPLHTTAVVQDITQRKAAEDELSRLYFEARCREAELRDKQEQLVQAGKLATLGEMATGIAHELNNPLNNIGLFLGNVLDQIEMGRLDPDRIAKNVRDSLVQVRKAAEIISHLRVFGRGETLTLKPCPLHRVIQDALSLLNQQLRLRQIQVDLDLVGQPVVLGNAIQLEQVFINLVTNARDALVGTEGGRISIRSRSGPDWVEVQVEDNGPGIPAGLEQRIFDPFFTTKEPGHGTGLGLSISYSIIKAHQGDITVVSPPGSGARFAVRLPLASDEVQQDILGSCP